ncbi:MAG: pitrilysin family protein [Candidatus Kapabacteria bacterium]|nr:pitrilysin family protein [Candidatus Kapabacteria bacterium]
MKTMLIHDPNDPTVSFNILFKVGSQNDPRGKEGLASLTADLITEGATKNNSYEQIINTLYPMSAGYGNKVDKEMTAIKGRVHIDNINKYYNLLMESILNPAFNEDDFNRIKNEKLDQIEKTLRYSSDEELGKAMLHAEIFEFTPYSHLTEGTVNSLKSITINDVKEFYIKFYTNINYVAGLAGNFSDDLPVKIINDLNKLPDGIPSMVGMNPKPIKGLEITIVEKKNASTAISFGYPIKLLRGEPDFIPLCVFNSWFGEHRNQSSHLYNVIREERGLNYGDYSYIEPFLNGGALNMPEPNNARRNQIFEVWIRPVQHKHKLFALRAALRELNKVVNSGISEKDFNATKTFLSKYCAHYASTNSARLGYAIDNQYYMFDDGQNYVKYFQDNLTKLTYSDVQKAIKKYIQDENIKIVMITSDAEKLKQDLINNTPSPITYDSEKAKHILDEDKEIESFPIKVKAENIKIVKVENVFEK